MSGRNREALTSQSRAALGIVNLYRGLKGSASNLNSSTLRSGFEASLLRAILAASLCPFLKVFSTVHKTSARAGLTQLVNITARVNNSPKIGLIRMDLGANSLYVNRLSIGITRSDAATTTDKFRFSGGSDSIYAALSAALQPMTSPRATHYAQ